MTDQDAFSFVGSQAPAAAELLIPRRAPAKRDSEPLAALANSYLEQHREHHSRETTDVETDAFVEAQGELLDRMQNTPAVILDDLIAKLAVIRQEIWDRAGGDEEQLDAADHLVFTLADDLRRVIGATTACRFDPRLWIESAIRAGMDPSAIICLVPSEHRARPGYKVTSRRLCCRVADVNPAYEPPPLSSDETNAVLDELERRGRADRHYRQPEEIAVAELAARWRAAANVAYGESRGHTDEETLAFSDEIVALVEQMAQTPAANTRDLAAKVEIGRREMLERAASGPIDYVDTLLLSLLDDIQRLAGAATRAGG